ncbi:MAG: single-stranded-DNA-specific exonuclease RecJ, partial [Myxococcota bacterium]|nr:single-stranded-DNA-specific exonuclease RecJ [Myxococcota bacterium]
LTNRGISSVQEARGFLNPRLKDLPDPFLMKGMEDAVSRIVRGMDAGESICVWGDYDVDGVTSASQLVAFFEVIGYPVTYFVPERFTDGYGLNAHRIQELADDDVQLLITVDCGISNAEEVEVAREGGMDVIVVDHHQIPPQLPKAAAVLDPVQSDCDFPYKSLAACGVTFMLLVALRKRLRDLGRFAEGAEPDLRRWLDLTAIGTVADMVPLKDLNRLIVHYGLQRISQTDRPGVKALCDVAGIEPNKVTAGRIGFHLGPRINAAGRVAHAGAGVELLTTSNAEDANRMARDLDGFNVERRRLQATVFEEACAMADAHPRPQDRRSIVLASTTWHAGVLGIVASKLVERHHRPTVLLAIEDGVAKGSARSISGFRLVEHLEQISEMFLSYGGHDHAAGVSLQEERFQEFVSAFERLATDTLTEEHLRPRLRTDMEVPVASVSMDLVETLTHLAPYGQGNPEPSLVARGVRVLSHRAVGQDQSHLKLVLEAGGRRLDAIAFGMADRSHWLSAPVDLVYIPEINEYRGNRTLQLRIKAIQPTIRAR